MFDEFSFPARRQLESTLVVVRRTVGPANGVVDVGAGVLAVTPGRTRLPLPPGYAHPAERAHAVVTAATGF